MVAQEEWRGGSEKHKGGARNRQEDALRRRPPQEEEAERWRGGAGGEWGGEESSTGHQLLSDYIIPDIKTTHTARVPTGGPRKEGGGGVRASLAPKPIPIHTPRPARGRGNGPPIPALPRGCTSQRCPPARPREESELGQLAGSPAGRPGDCTGQQTAAQGPAAGAALRGGAGSQRLRSIPAAPRRIPGSLPARRSGSGAHSHGPLPALLWRGRSVSGGSSAGPGAGGPSESAQGAAPGVPGRAAGSLPGAGGGRRAVRRGRRLCVRPGSPSVRGVNRRAPGRRWTRGSEGNLASAPAAGRRAGLGGFRLAATPPPLPRQPPSQPARLLTDGATATTRRRCRGCSQLLALMLQPLQPSGE